MKVSFDPARELTMYLRSEREGAKKFIFNNADNSPFDISALDFELTLKQYLDGAKSLSLTLASGLEIGGDDNNELTVTLTAETSALSPGKYFWELLNLTAGKTWLNGDAIVHNGKYDNATTDTQTIVVNTEPDEVLITIVDPSNGTLTEIDGGNP
jgi:hypothetical protein